MKRTIAVFVSALLSAPTLFANMTMPTTTMPTGSTSMGSMADPAFMEGAMEVTTNLNGPDLDLSDPDLTEPDVEPEPDPFAMYAGMTAMMAMYNFAPPNPNAQQIRDLKTQLKKKQAALMKMQMQFNPKAIALAAAIKRRANLVAGRNKLIQVGTPPALQLATKAQTEIDKLDIDIPLAEGKLQPLKDKIDELKDEITDLQDQIKALENPEE